ncbi:helix-turn-helix domain-containing protein [Tumebacillus lipolyticus]|uniref:Tetratricopeptide repeat protein n=1 Tax=Tumebacillus lipolyticus TaxID=1280370 RepID=A0ABW4ZXJ7_9BACL
MNEAYKKIGERIKHHRLNRKLSQDELAEGICSRQTISLLENGQHLPSTEFMKKFATKLGIPLHEILVDDTKELEVKVQLDIIKVYVETENYISAIPLIEELDQLKDLLEYQRRDLILFYSECLMRTGRADQAIVKLTELIQRLELERESDDHLMATLYNKLGSAYYMNADNVKAYSTYQQAYQISQRFAFNLTSADIAFNLGMICSLMRMREEAMNYYKIAKSYFDDASDVKRLAYTLFNLALVHRQLRELPIANKYLLQATAIFESLNMINRVNIAKQEHAYYVLSETEPEEAIKNLLQCAVEFAELGDTPLEIYTYSRLAKVLIKYNRFDESKEYLLTALGMIPENQSYNHLCYPILFQVHATYLLHVKDFEKCIDYSFKSTDIFDKMGLSNDAAESLQLSAEAFEKLGMFDKAYHLQRKVCDLLRQAKDN